MKFVISDFSTRILPSPLTKELFLELRLREYKEDDLDGDSCVEVYRSSFLFLLFDRVTDPETDSRPFEIYMLFLIFPDLRWAAISD